MSIRRLGIVNPNANTDSNGFTAVQSSYLASVVVTNKGATQQTARVWVVPNGASQVSQYGYIIYDVAVPAGNSIETHRFGIDNGDSVWVRGSSSDLSFMINGVYDATTSIDAHLTQTTNVHGIANTANLATQTYATNAATAAQTAAATALAAHEADTTNIHGIANTANLATLTTTNSLNTRLIAIELGLGIFD
jgi:hypothetical protein